MVQGAVSLVGVLVVVFVLLHLVADPAAVLAPPDASAEQVEALRTRMGFNDPVWLQLARFLFRAATGEFGQSYYYNEPAATVFLERLPATLELTAAAMLFAVVVGLLLGVLAAVRSGSLADGAAMMVAVAGQAAPTFWLGIMLILVFSVRLRLFPTSGRETPLHLVLPALTLGMYAMAQIARLTRAEFLGILTTDYVRTARAKGLSERVVLFRHVLRNAMLPVVTVVGLQLGQLLGGAVITENVFAWPGVGRLVTDSITRRDFPVVLVSVLLLGLFFILINLMVDMFYAVLDPRIRYD